MAERHQATEEEVLQRRAQALGRAAERREGAARRRPLIVFALGGARYAVPLETVEATCRVEEVHPLPGVARHILGFIRRRGRSMALISLRRFFDLESSGIADADYAIIASVAGKRFALAVEQIEGVEGLAGDELLPPPENLASALVPVVARVTLRGLTVLDLERLVALERFGARQTAGEGAR